MTEQYEAERLKEQVREVVEERVRGLGSQLPEIEVLEERVRDLERQLAQEQASHLTEKEIWKHELMRAKINARLQIQDEIAARRAAQFAD